MKPGEWDALRAEDEQHCRDQTGPYAPAGNRPTRAGDHHPDMIDLDNGTEQEWPSEDTTEGDE